MKTRPTTIRSRHSRTLTERQRKQALARRDRKLLAIAKSVLNLQTLEARKCDGLDFHELSVWSIKAALEEAFAAGANAGFDFAQKGRCSHGA